ncbi:topoisomerase DNA-binding C4 zinc finger domain-containing protein [Uliginosibacterium sp. 31-16]|uniref:restriction endonuclease n=1 Tax=Uliginosibacterium sp. 31-16 TaxID=3068315 RepID=UPI00274014F7|nr:restriction endonuclease [Uliginosibacterium sp. 31-16]MDP5239699.1 topoisomerase DNA-binding C4 zinc finger domain-containing protein [Uliginosibacterium sp. 31-16]
MPATRLHPADPGPLAPLWGLSWQAAAWRACGVFLLGYVLPRLYAGHAVAGVQWLATILSFGLAALAVFRYQQAYDPAQAGDEEPVVLLSDAAASPSTLDAVVSAAAPQSASKPRKWTVELLHVLEWRRMADVCLAFYRERGLTGELAGVGADGSMEVRLYQGARTPDDEQAPFALLHCKARGEQEVGTEAIEALQRRMVESGVSRAFFMGAWSFDEAAQRAAKSMQITLIDDRMFLSMINRLPHDESQRLLNLAVEGDYTTPSCPTCGLKMISRQNEQGRYWGCRAFPRCKATLGMQS